MEKQIPAVPVKFINEVIGETIKSVFDGLKKQSLMDIALDLPKLIEDVLNQGYLLGFEDGYDKGYDELLNSKPESPIPAENI